MSFPRYPAYKDSGVKWLGEVPKHWEVMPLQRLVEPDRPVMYGIVLPGPDVGAGVPVLKGGNVRPQRMKLSEVAFTTPEIEEPYARARLREGDLVYSIRGSIGDCEPVPKELVGANITQDVARIAIPSVDVPSFIRWALLSSPVREDLASGSLGAAVRGVNIYDLRRARIPTPPLSERAVIADYLDTETARIDALVGEQEHLIELLREKRQAVISHAVTKGLDPTVQMKDSGLEWLGKLPAHWKVRRLDLMFTQVKRLVTVDPVASYQELGVRSHGRGVFHKEPLRGIDLDDKEVYWVEPGALVFNIVFAWEGAVAITGAADTGLVASHRFPMFIADEQQAVPAFYKHFITTNPGIRLLDWHSPGAAGRNRTLKRSDLLKEPVPAPPVAEQIAICEALASEFSRVDTLIAEAERAIALLQERRAALISAAVTGQIDVRGLAPEATV